MHLTVILIFSRSEITGRLLLMLHRQARDTRSASHTLISTKLDQKEEVYTNRARSFCPVNWWCGKSCCRGVLSINVKTCISGNVVRRLHASDGQSSAVVPRSASQRWTRDGSTSCYQTIARQVVLISIIRARQFIDTLRQLSGIGRTNTTNSLHLRH